MHKPGLDRGERMTTVSRILGLDYGERRIGVAISDPLGITAQGMETLVRKDREKDFQALGSIIDSHDVERIVIGLPIRMDGTSGRQAQRVEKFAQQLRDRLGIPVETWDERLTTVEADRILREDPRKRSRKKGLADRLAAVLILQGYMNRGETPVLPGETPVLPGDE